MSPEIVDVEVIIMGDELETPEIIESISDEARLLVNEEPEISPDLPANDELKSSNKESHIQSKTYPSGYLTREQRWTIDHNENPDKIDVDANTCLFNIEQGNDPHDFMEMTHRERLIGEEILRRRLEDAGECIWLDTDEEWIKNKTILQENGLLW
ncbi:4673_t:CDS:2 [Paraglomus occultum]|uniref:4673_t:CDS:1 n=1 Tax=Paraglomus occultum TaxID=144539 RepID=A0A9N8ZLL9_9GLOM|nr:4673_t:CDS:2 [Paraglomus occultum]